MKTLKEASQYTSNLTAGTMIFYLGNEYIEEGDSVSIEPYYDAAEHCIAVPLTVTMGKAVVLCKIQLPRDVIMECINDAQDYSK